METRKLNVSFSTSGSGSKSTRVMLPISWLKQMCVTGDSREITAEFDGKKIIIKKFQDSVDK